MSVPLSACRSLEGSGSRQARWQEAPVVGRAPFFGMRPPCPGLLRPGIGKDRPPGSSLFSPPASRLVGQPRGLGSGALRPPLPCPGRWGRTWHTGRSRRKGCGAVPGRWSAAAWRKRGACLGALRKLPKMRKRHALGD